MAVARRPKIPTWLSRDETPICRQGPKAWRAGVDRRVPTLYDLCTSYSPSQAGKRFLRKGNLPTREKIFFIPPALAFELDNSILVICNMKCDCGQASWAISGPIWAMSGGVDPVERRLSRLVDSPRSRMARTPTRLGGLLNELLGRVISKKLVDWDRYRLGPLQWAKPANEGIPRWHLF